MIHRFPCIGIAFNEDNIWKRKRIPIRITKCSERQPRNQRNPTNPRDSRQRFAPIQPEMYGIPLRQGNATTQWKKSGSIGKNQKKSVKSESIGKNRNKSEKIRFDGFPIRKKRGNRKNRKNRNKSEKVRFTGVRHQIQPDSTTTAWNRKKSENQFWSPANRKNWKISFPNNGNQWIPLDSSDRNRFRKNRENRKIGKIGF